ncbi:MAG: type 1 glutamine amidotransferase [Thermoleophilia bacterium]|nr:type 1 glutamine amidotransferase [Thermoleophilia bacterium]
MPDKKIAVFLAKGFEDHELIEPVNALRGAGAKVVLIGMSEADKRGVRGKLGTVVSADTTIDLVDQEDFDLLLIPGGKGPALLRQDERILDFVREFDREGKPIAAICHGPQVLVSAGVLKGRTATSYHSVVPELKEAGANFVSEPVAADRNIITSRKVEDIPDFTEAIFEALKAPERKTA